MSLSAYSRDFQNSLREFRERGITNLSSPEGQEVLNKIGVTRDEFLSARDRYVEAAERGETDFRGLEELGDIGAPLRVLGRAVGDAASGIIESSAKILEEVGGEDIVNSISSAADSFGESVPESVKLFADEVFDPYHGEGLLGTVEDFSGTIGSYLIPGKAIIKGTNLALRTGRATPGVRAVVDDGLDQVENNKRIKGFFDMGAKGAAYSAGAALIEEPEDNLVNILLEQFPEAEEYLGRIAVDPNDSEAEQLLKAFIANAGFGAALAPITAGAIYSAKFGLDGAGKVISKLPPIPEFSVNVPVLGEVTKDFFKINFSSLRGLSRESRDALVARENAGVAGVAKALPLSQQLDKVLADEYAEGIITINKKNYDIREAAYNALTGKEIFNINNFKEGTKEVLQRMRNNIDAETKRSFAVNPDGVEEFIFAKDVSRPVAGIRGETAVKFNENLDAYVTQSYKFFDNPKFRKQRQKELQKYVNEGVDTSEGKVFERAVRSLLKEGEMTDSGEARKLLQELLDANPTGDVTKDLLTMANKFSTVKVGGEKKLKSQSFKDLLGEVKDPSKSYQITMGKLAELNAEKELMNTIAQDVINSGAKVFPTAPGIGDNIGKAKDLGEIATQRARLVFGLDDEAAREFATPLQNVFYDQAYYTALKDGLNSVRPDSGVMKAFVAMKGLSQTAATALSIPTHGVNMMGNEIMLIANGMFGGKELGKSIKFATQKVLEKPSKEMQERYGRYIELGVASSGLTSGVIRKNLQALDVTAQKNPEKVFTGLNDFKKAPAVTTLKGVRKLLFDKPLESYQLEDDVFKIAHFENTLTDLKKSQQLTKKFNNLGKERNLSGKDLESFVEKQFEEAAAKRTRDLMPNYNLTPRFVQNIRSAPIGDFAAFPAEMMRITMNLAKYTIDDITSSDPALQAMGFKRLGGSTAVAVAGPALSAYSREMHGITKEQAEAAEFAVPDWEYKTNKIWTSPFGIDEETGHYGAGYFNQGRLDPFEYVRNGFRLLHSGLALNNLDAVENNKLLFGSLDQLAGPFLTPSMITEAGIQVLSGKTRYGDETDSLVGTLANRLEPLVGLEKGVFVPGTVKLLQRRINYNDSVNARGEGNALKDRSGAVYEPGETDLGAWLGLKRQFLDVTANTPFMYQDSFNKINRAGAPLNVLLSTEAGLGPEDRQEIIDKMVEAQRVKAEGLKEVRALTKKMRALYGDDFNREFYRGLNFKRDQSAQNLASLSQAMNNTFAPYMPKRTKSQFVLDQYRPDEDLFRIYQEYAGARLE